MTTTSTHDRAAIHFALANVGRLAIMDYLATVPDASGNAVSKAIGRSETWVSHCLTMLQKVGLVERKTDPKRNAFDQDVRNSIAAGVVWPVNVSINVHTALSNPDRIAIMDYLADAGESSVTEIAAGIKRSQVQTTQHLIKMRRAGMIVSRRDKQMVYNRIADGFAWPLVVRS